MASSHSNIHRLRPRLRLVIDNVDSKIPADRSTRFDPPTLRPAGA